MDRLPLGKECSKCHTWKLHDQFYARRAACKDCLRAQQRQRNIDDPDRRRRSRERSADKIREYNRRYKEQHADYVRAYQRAYDEEYADRRRKAARRRYWQDPESARAKSRASYRKNRDEALRTNREWWADHPGYKERYMAAYRVANSEQMRQYARDRKGRKRGNGGAGLTLAQWTTILQGAGGCCLRCGSSEDVCADHVVPLCADGEHDVSNVQPLCRGCNLTKGRKFGPEWDFRP